MPKEFDESLESELKWKAYFHVEGNSEEKEDTRRHEYGGKYNKMILPMTFSRF